MKKFWIFFLMGISINAQIIISPYVVYIDQEQKFGSYIVQNESNEDYEINISFVFGHPVSDSQGNVSMKYYDNPTDTFPSIVNWIRVFPKSFVLAPKQRQVIRMTVRPPESLKGGTYWARIVTSAAPKAPSISTQTSGVSAKINFVLNQVTTVLYRIEPANTGLLVHDIYTNLDSTNLNIYTDLERTGNSPFWSDIFITISDSQGQVVADNREYLPIYYRMVKKYPFDIKKFSHGKYNVEIRIVFNEKEDIPESKMMPIPPIIKTMYVEIP